MVTPMFGDEGEAVTICLLMWEYQVFGGFFCMKACKNYCIHFGGFLPKFPSQSPGGLTEWKQNLLLTLLICF